MPLVSVIVPVYKAEAYLHKCVDSLLAQTMTDFEVLLIDDGSPDRSGEICDEYAAKDSRIRVFHKENGGVASARQVGLENVRGEYTIHADPDDWVEPTMLEELYAKAKENDADMVICDYYVDYADSVNYSKQQPTSLDYKSVQCEIFGRLHGAVWNKLIKTSVIKKTKTNFSLELSFCEDLHFNAQILKNNIKISYLGKAFYHYVQGLNNNSLVFSYNKSTFNRDIRMAQIFNELMKNTESYDLCVQNMDYLILYRSFISNVFSSREYKELMYNYRTRVKSNGLLKKNKLTNYVYFSCIGFYGICYNFQRIIFFLKRILKSI